MLEKFIIGFCVAGVILTIEKAGNQLAAVLAFEPIEGTWVTADAYNSAGEFLSEVESLTGCFS